MKKYKWIAECSDGAYNDESALFDTEKECYENMRKAVLEKMKWNTEYSDYDDIPDDDYIGYEVHFGRNKITHKSYSGLYTYKIVEVETKKSYRVWQSFQGSIGVDVMAEDEDEAYRIGSKLLQDMPDIDVIRNSEWNGVQVDLN